MIKICFLTNELSFKHGWGRYSIDLIKALTVKGYKPLVLMDKTSQENDLREAESYKLLSSLRSDLVKPIFIWKDYLRVRKIVQDCQIIHSLIEPYAPLASLLAGNRPFFITAHGTYAPLLFDKPLAGRLIKKSFKKANKVFCVSEFTQKEILKKISSKIIFGVGGLLCIAFGAITKETIVVAPILMGAYIVIVRLKSWKSRLPVILFTSAAAILLVIFALIMFKAITFSPSLHFSAKPFEILWRDTGESPIVYYSTQIRVLVRFLRLCIFPYGQCVEFWISPSTSFTNFQVILASGIHLSIIGFALFMWRRQPFILFGIFWFYIFLMPSSILPNGIFEHRIYTALAGLLFAIFIPIGYELLNQPLRMRKAVGIISLTLIASLILCFIFMSHLRNKIWKSEYSLWRECTTTSPNNWRANVNYGYALLNQGKYIDAKYYLEKSFQQKSNVWAVANNLGLLYSYINDIDGSIRMFEYGLKLKPQNRMLKGNLGACYLQKGLITKGTNLLYKARTPESFVTLGNYFLNKGNYDEALKCYERVLKKYPDDIDALAGKQACIRLR